MQENVNNVNPLTKSMSTMLKKAKYSLLNHGLPFSLSLPNREAVNLGLNLGSPFTHVILNIKDKWVLPKVGIHDLSWGL